MAEQQQFGQDNEDSDLEILHDTAVSLVSSKTVDLFEDPEHDKHIKLPSYAELCKSRQVSSASSKKRSLKSESDKAPATTKVKLYKDSDLEILHDTAVSLVSSTTVDLCEDPEHDKHIKLPSYAELCQSRQVSPASSKKRKLKSESDKAPPTKKVKLDKDNNSCVNPTKLQPIQCGDNSLYKYYLRRNGLFYEGNCKNECCDVFNEWVTIKRGYGVIFPHQDIANKIPKCPGCQHVFEVRYVSVSKCTATMTYQETGSSDRWVKTDIGPVVAGSFIRIGDQSNRSESLSLATDIKLFVSGSVSSRVKYQNLKFEVHKLPNDATISTYTFAMPE